jgi:hypothetical protein
MGTNEVSVAMAIETGVEIEQAFWIETAGRPMLMVLKVRRKRFSGISLVRGH